jgi:hypothetical protein
MGYLPSSLSSPVLGNAPEVVPNANSATLPSPPVVEVPQLKMVALPTPFVVVAPNANTATLPPPLLITLVLSAPLACVMPTVLYCTVLMSHEMPTTFVANTATVVFMPPYIPKVSLSACR